MIANGNAIWARDTAVRMMAKHKLFGWQFKFDRSRRRAGVCKHPTSIRPGTISLSIYYCSQNSKEDILDTILHEIAHALVGPGHGHDDVWKAKCVEIGAKPQRCYDDERIVMPKGRWWAKCSCCNKNFYRHRKPKSLTGWSCKKCGPELGKIEWKDRQTNKLR